MRKLFTLLVLVFALNKSNAQILSFLKSDEFQRIKSHITKVSYHSESPWPWIGDLEKDKPQNEYISDPKIEYVYSDKSGDMLQSIYLDKDYVIFSYHPSIGADTGTLIYHRTSQKLNIFKFHAIKLKGRILSVVREGYKDGHWWQDGKFNLITQKVTWSKNIDR